MGDLKFLLYSGIGISLIMFAGAIVMAELVTNYGLVGGESINTLQSYGKITNITKDFSDTVQSTQQTGSTTDNPIQTFVAGAWAALKLLFNLPDIFINLAADMIRLSPFPIPVEFVVLFGIVISMMIIVVMFQAIFKILNP